MKKELREEFLRCIVFEFKKNAINIIFSFFIVILFLGSYQSFFEYIYYTLDKLYNYIQLNFGFSEGIGIKKQIVLFNLNDSPIYEAIIPIVMDTFLKSLISLMIVFSVSSLLNFIIILKKINYLKSIKNLLNFFSIIHVIIFALIIKILFVKSGTSIDNIFFYLIAGFTSNIFYDIAKDQSEHLIALLKKDFILASRAWGDEETKYLKRPILLKSLDILISNWIPIITNVLILEIIFQKGGVGSEIYDIYFNPNSEIIYSNNELFISLIFIMVIIFSFIYFFKNLLATYLIEIKR